MRIEELQAELTKGPEDSDTFARRWTDADTPLGKGTRIRFNLEDGHFIEAYIDNDFLELYGNEPLLIRGRASNVLAVRPDRP
jgi:hypothetical protein